MRIVSKCKECGKTVYLMPLSAAGMCTACHTHLKRAAHQGGKLDASFEKWHKDRERHKIINEWTPIRRDSKQKAASMGWTLFQMRGPVDLRTSEICLEHVGQTKTAEEWEQIAPHAFTQGLHGQGCRHFFDPVKSTDAPSVLEYQEFASLQVVRVRAMRNKPKD